MYAVFALRRIDPSTKCAMTIPAPHTTMRWRIEHILEEKGTSGDWRTVLGVYLPRQTNGKGRRPSPYEMLETFFGGSLDTHSLRNLAFAKGSGVGRRA